MRKGFFPVFFIVFLLICPVTSFAMDIEAAVGLWHQVPSGNLGYKGNSLSIDDELNLGSENQFMARLKLNLPVFLPNLYFMGTWTDFTGRGQTSLPFKFGDFTFSNGVPFDSKLQYNHYDIALFYPIPLLKTATLNKLNLELGLDARIVNLRAQVSQQAVTQTEDLTAVVPMLYAGVQIRPVKYLGIEGEIRGLAIGSEDVFDVIGRVKVKPISLLFISAGYRYESINIDQSGLKADFKIKGPFIETGVEF